MSVLQDKLLANGIHFRILSAPEGVTRSEICMIIPAGENHEGTDKPQAAHACEHLCCAFNGGFSRPYGFLHMRDVHGCIVSATTHCEHTQYCITNIPTKSSAIEDSVRFFKGIFEPIGFRSEAGEREFDIIRSELRSGNSNQALIWAMAYWIRQGDAKPTESALHHYGMTGLTMEDVLSFHREYYRPEHVSVVAVVPEKGSAIADWDAMFMRYMTSNVSTSFSRWLTPNRGGSVMTLPSGCKACTVPKGLWEVPCTGKDSWVICAVPFYCRSSDKGSLSEIRARTLIASMCRLSGSSDPKIITATDYIRINLGVSYNLYGSTLSITDSTGRRCSVAILGTATRRDITSLEAHELFKIMNNHVSSIPGRGAVGNLTAWFMRNRQSVSIREGFRMAKIPFVDKLSWDILRSSYNHSNIHNGDGCVIFSSHSD